MPTAESSTIADGKLCDGHAVGRKGIRRFDVIITVRGASDVVVISGGEVSLQVGLDAGAPMRFHGIGGSVPDSICSKRLHIVFSRLEVQIRVQKVEGPRPQP